MELVRDVSDLDHFHVENILPCYEHVKSETSKRHWRNK
jgi:hypothetical protein